MKWVGTICFLLAAVLLSSNIEISRYGFLLFLFGHVILTYHFFYKERDYPLIVQNGFFIFVDFFGIYRWFIA